MHLVSMLIASLLASPIAESPLGNWKMTIKVGHVGEGLRTVILEISEDNDGYRGELTSMQNRMTDADEVTFEDDVLSVWYGSYHYELTIEGDEATGTVTSPSGVQSATARRQQTQLFAGDAPEPYQKTWRGTIERGPEGYTLVTRRNAFGFQNASEHESELTRFDGQSVTITGLWRVDRIEIQTIAPDESER